MYEPVKKFLIGFYSSILIVIVISYLGANTLPNYTLLLVLIPFVVYKIFRKSAPRDFAPTKPQERQLKSPKSRKRSYQKLAFAVGLGLLSVIIAAYYIIELINMPLERNIRIWQRTVFVFSLCGAGIYYLCNPDKFKTLGDKVTFFSGGALGPPTAVGFLE